MGELGHHYRRDSVHPSNRGKSEPAIVLEGPKRTPFRYIPIQDGLWVGDAGTIRAGFLLPMKISHVVNCAPTEVAKPANLEYRSVCLRPQPWESPTSTLDYEQEKKFLSDFRSFDYVYSFINSALQDGGSVLIYSLTGECRAPFVLLLFLMRKYRWNLKKCAHFFYWRSKKKFVLPEEYENSLLCYQSYVGCSNSLEWNGKVDNPDEAVLMNTLLNTSRIDYTVEEKKGQDKGRVVFHSSSSSLLSLSSLVSSDSLGSTASSDGSSTGTSPNFVPFLREPLPKKEERSKLRHPKRTNSTASSACKMMDEGSEPITASKAEKLEPPLPKDEKDRTIYSNGQNERQVSSLSRSKKWSFYSGSGKRHTSPSDHRTTIASESSSYNHSPPLRPSLKGMHSDIRSPSSTSPSISRFLGVPSRLRSGVTQ